MDVGDFHHRVATVVLSLAPRKSELRDDTQRLVEDLGYTSLGLMELAMELSLEFDIEPLDAERLADVRTVADVVSFVEGLVG